jgi:hypothetical protein
MMMCTLPAGGPGFYKLQHLSHHQHTAVGPMASSCSLRMRSARYLAPFFLPVVSYARRKTLP